MNAARHTTVSIGILLVYLAAIDMPERGLSIGRVTDSSSSPPSRRFRPDEKDGVVEVEESDNAAITTADKANSQKRNNNE